MLADDLRDLPPASSRWFELDPDRVAGFADATEDRQFIHLDEARAARESPFGGAIAHGFLTLSMLASMSGDVLAGMDGLGARVNYGFDRIRFISPVRVGSRIRGVFSVAGVEENFAQDGATIESLDVHWDVEIEVDGKDRPALAANWITRFFPAG